MHVISKKKLIGFWQKHPKAETSLQLWYKLAKSASWQNFVELRQVFPAADQVGNFTVFNIGGNKYRLIASVKYASQKIFIRYILTHAEYDKENWKKDSWYE